MVPLVQFPYRLTASDGELYEVGGFTQEFDPWQAVLFTEVEATIVRMRVTTFLTQNGLYAERYQIVHADKKHSPSILFLARSPIDYSCGMCDYQMNFPEDFLVSFHDQPVSVQEGESICLTGEYSFSEVEGGICVGVNAHGKKLSIKFFDNNQAQVKISGLKKGDVIERYISLQDTTHTPDYRTESIRLVKEALAGGYTYLYQEHRKWWHGFQCQTELILPDKEMENIYRKSLWLVRASQNQETGFITEGLYSGFKGGGYACNWDLIFACRALVTANQRESAIRLLDWYQRGVEYAHIYAGQLGRPGAYFPWMANGKGESINFADANEFKNIEKFNNGCMAIQLFDPYRFWGDKKQLRKRMPLIKEILDFLIAETVMREGTDFIIKPLQGADENIDRTNDTMHLLTLIEGLAGYLEGCRILGIEVKKKYQIVFEGLKESLEHNYQNGILLQFRGDPGKPVSSAAFTFHLLRHPKGIGSKGIREAFKANQGKWGLTNVGTYRNLIWPWTETRAAIAFSCVDPRITYERLRHVIRFTSSLGIFPEKVRPDGFWILFGYLSAHSSFVQAVNSLMASDNGTTLYVGAGFPGDWKDVRFANIYTSSGWGVTFQVKEGKVKQLTIENCWGEARRLTIRVLNPVFGKEFRIIKRTLNSGKTCIV